MVKNVLSPRQYDVMKILWDENRPMHASEIVKTSLNLNINTVQASLKKLVEEGYVEIPGISYSGKVLARQYQAKISRDEYMKKIYTNLLEMSSPEKVMTSLIECEQDVNVLNRLENLIKEVKDKLL